MSHVINKFVILCSIIISGCSIRSVYIKETFAIPVPEIVQDSISHSIFLIGDAGKPIPEGIEPTFALLAQHASVNPERSTIIFLGDNIYPNGLPDEYSSSRKEMERRINEQIEIGKKSGAQTIFVPGNHDWDYQGKDGWNAIKREQAFIESKNLSNVTMLPRDGFPGPSIVEIGNEIRIVVIDTEWWLHKYEKPLYANDTTEEQTKRRFLDSLTWAISSANGKKIIVVAHHPIESHGEHGGFFELKDHLFPLQKLYSWLWLPLPGIGSLYPLSRMWGISDQDFSGTNNTIMRMKLDSVLSQHNVLIYAAGHEHTLQVMNKRAHHYYLVSGNGIQNHSEALTTGKNTLLASRYEGFMRVDFSINGSVRLGVISLEGNKRREIFSMMLR